MRNLTLCAGLLVLTAPGAAHAAAVEDNTTWLSFVATSGEVNDLTVSQSGGSITFNDPGKTIDTTTAGGLCGAPSGGQVTCTLGERQVKIDLGDGDDRYASTATTYTKVAGGDGADTLSGGPAVEKLHGGLGDDTLTGGDGDDTLDGFDGVDTLAGDGGADQLDGGNDNDTLAGGDGNDKLGGALGSDALDGGAGNDTLAGGADADSYTGGDGHDLVDWSDETTRVTADFNAVADDGVAGSPELLPGDVEEIVGGSGPDHLTAGPAGTVVIGNAGADRLSGGLGNDKLHGGAGSDELTGGGGIDEFYGDAGTDRVFARDGATEVVSCGTDADFAAVDPLDLLAGDCESVNDGVAPLGGDTGGDGSGAGGSTDAPPPPRAGRSVTVAPARGVVRVRTPGGRPVVLRDGDDVPVGSLVDTRRGAVTLTSAADASGKTQTAQFSHGVFQVRQKRGPRPITELLLKGRLDCKVAKRRGKVESARGPHGRKKRRRLWGSGKGRFRTRGRRSSATVRGTIWMTEDRCNGTYTKVKQGVVAVKDFRTGKTKLVRAGKSHFAKRGAAKRRSRR